MGSCAGVFGVFPELLLQKNCSKVSSFHGSNNNNISLSFPARFGSDSKNPTFLKHFPVASAASISGSGAEFTGSEPLVDVQRKQKGKGIAGIDQDELEDPKLLADPDSCFCEFRGLEIHHKVCDAKPQVNEADAVSSQAKKVGIPMILLHGFGASVFSWSRVMKPLAEAVGSTVLAFDRPAFGLTTRVDQFRHSPSGNEETKPVNPYSMAFAVLVTLYFIDFLSAEKAILVGHSAGCLVVVDSYFEAPERIAAMILVAPAIVAPRTIGKVEEDQSGDDNRMEEDDSNSSNIKNPFNQVFKILSKFSKSISQAILRVVKGMADMFRSLYKKLLSAFLRSAFAVMLVRMAIDKFGTAAVRNAWYDSKKVTEYDIQGYTKPLKVKGWDKGLLEYTAAILTDTSSESKPPLAKRLCEISCPVLIVTGDNDRIVPAWNAKRLSRAIPGSCFEVIKHCGHLPHEEKVDEFVSVVKKFLQTAFGDFHEPHLQVVA